MKKYFWWTLRNYKKKIQMFSQNFNNVFMYTVFMYTMILMILIGNILICMDLWIKKNFHGNTGCKEYEMQKTTFIIYGNSYEKITY